MTETTTFPFSQLEDAPLEVETSADHRRLVLVLGAFVLALAVLGGAVLALVGGGGSAPDSTFTPTASGPRAAAAPEAPTEAVTVPSGNTDALARSPFEAKYVAPAPPPTDAGDGSPQVVTQPVLDADGNPVLGADGAPVLVDPGPGYVPVTDAAPAPGSPAAGGAPAAPAPREYQLVLASVSLAGGVPTASFTIDGVTSTVRATEIFGPSSQLLLRSLQQGPKDGQWTATIQMGDAEPIDVVTGETVYIR